MRLTALALLALTGCLPPSPRLQRPESFQRGVALGLFLPGADAPGLRSQLDEVHALAASDVSLIVTWVQDDVTASEVRADPAFTPDDELIRKTIRAARERGLRVTLFPIVRLVHRTAAEWRGVARPDDPAGWFRSYRARLSELARIAEEEHAAQLCVGSELASLESRADDWRAVIAEARALYRGRLLYSANWDRYAEVRFWDALDLVGVSAYWGVTGRDATVEEARASWNAIRARLAAFVRTVGRPLVLTEVGYPSVRGAGAWPWNDFLAGDDGVPDAETQRRLYEAFMLAWSDEPSLSGAFFWFWQGAGGLGDRSYSFRRKPAEHLVRAWYRTDDWRPLTR